MKAEDIRDWDEVEMRARLKELREEQFKLRFQSATMELENPRLLRSIRKDIARLRAFLTGREYEVGSSPAEQTG